MLFWAKNRWQNLSFFGKIFSSSWFTLQFFHVEPKYLRHSCIISVNEIDKNPQKTVQIVLVAGGFPVCILHLHFLQISTEKVSTGTIFKRKFTVITHRNCYCFERKMSKLLSTTERLRAQCLMILRHVWFDNFKNFRTFWQISLCSSSWWLWKKTLPTSWTQMGIR